MNFDDLHWLIFAGTPLLVIPKKFRHQWLGMMAPYDEKINSEVDSFDIEEINGKKYYMSDKMDFDNPQTHYDQICRIDSERPYLVFRVDDLNCLVFYSWAMGSPGGKKKISYSMAQMMILTSVILIGSIRLNILPETAN